VQSESAKHTSVHCVDVVSQKPLRQSPSPWQLAPSSPVPSDDEHAAMNAEVMTGDIAYPHSWLELPQSCEFRHASWQRLSWAQRPPMHCSLLAHVLPFAPVPNAAVQYAV
jgi:hypothetical protein